MLQRLMGLKWLAKIGLNILGMSTIKELFNSLGIEPTWKKDVTA